MLKKDARSGRQRLMDAARVAFRAESFGQSGVAAILEGAGVQAPTLYHHFGDKEGLYVEWATQELKELEPLFVALGDPAIETPAALRGFAQLLSQRLPFDLRELLRDAERLQKPESREAVLAAYLQAVYNPLYAILVRAKARGELKQEPMGLLAEAFIAGSLALGTHSWRSEQAEEGPAWWSNIFLHGCATSRPLL